MLFIIYLVPKEIYISLERYIRSLNKYISDKKGI